MLKHFSENISSGIKYHLYGHYKLGHEKLTNLTIESLKKHFLTYKKTETDTHGTKSQATHLVRSTSYVARFQPDGQSTQLPSSSNVPCSQP